MKKIICFLFGHIWQPDGISVRCNCLRCGATWVLFQHEPRSLLRRSIRVMRRGN